MSKSLIKVKSSNILGIGYAKESKEMLVMFKGGGTYSYSEVPETEFEKVIFSKSVGKAFRQIIKGKYESNKVVVKSTTIFNDEIIDVEVGDDGKRS